MKKHLLLVITTCVIFFQFSFGQSTANYTRTSTATASLIGMTGSTQLVAASRDDFSSELTSIGFDFWFMGTRFNSFSASSNGAIALGNTIIAATNYGNNFPFASQNIIAPFLQNMATSSTGKVHFTNTGTYPNRTLVVEFLNMELNKNSSSADGTFQVILNESTGVIQFIYGAMAIVGTGAVSADRTSVIGFCSSNAVNTVMSVTHATPFTTNTNATPTTVNYNSIAPIAGLNSAANGSRVQITFTPPVLNAPASLTFSATGTNTTTLNWTQLTVSGELGFVIMKSDDGGLTYDFAFKTAANAITATLTPLLANKNYYFKVFSLSEGGFSSVLTNNVTTTTCGSFVTNSATLGSQGNINWTALTWSLGHVPTPCEDAVITFNRSAGVNDSTSVVLDVDVSVNSLAVINASTTSIYKKQFSVTGDKRVEINGDLTLTCPSANKYSRIQWIVTDKTIVNGNLIVGTASPSATEGYSTVGSTGILPNQTYLLRGNATFNKRALTIDEHTIFIFDANGSQSLINNTGTMATDTFSDAILFEKLIIGDERSPILTFAGSNFRTNLNDKARAGVIIGANATLVLPANYSLNGEGAGLYFKMVAGSTVKCGGDATIDSYGVSGSNFTAGFTNYVLDANSTYEYNGSNAIIQTVYNGITYSKLVITNGSGSGRAPKITTGALTVNTSININALADLTLGALGSSNCAVSSAGPLNILGTGGLYCNANVISGAGAFSLGNYSFLGLGHAQGISILGSATGNIQMTGGRTYNTTGNFIYNGLVSQITGNGLSTTCNDLTIDNPNTVTIATDQLVNGINLLKQGTFDIGRTKITINGTGTLNSTGGFMKANVGIVEMKGTSGAAQNLAGSWFVGRNVSTLINANTTGITVAATLNDTLLISSALLYGSVTNSLITTNDNLTLLSRDTATASFGEIVTASGNSITGKVNIERYMQAKKSWRLLSTPISIGTSPTVTNAWREGGSGTISTGYGTQITGPGSFVGMDNYTQRASMKYYNSAINNFVDVTNTNTTSIANTKGYFVFVRGDRGVAVAGAASTTILRMKGDILTGNQTFSVPALKFESFGNPFPSRIDFRTITKTNIANSFVAWNPNSAGLYNVGAYETYVYDGTNYVKAGGAIRNYIESGEAVYVQSNVASAGSVVVKEADKGSGSSVQSRIGVTKPALEVTLFAYDGDNSSYVADGVFIHLDTAYSAGFDNNDVRKIMNIYDNLAIVSAPYNLVADRKPTLAAGDSIQLSINGMRTANYKFVIDPSLLNFPGINAYLKDNFLQIETPVSLTDTTEFSFETTADPMSKASNRFVIIFKTGPIEGLLFKKISAVRNHDDSKTIKWGVKNEINIDHYNVEKSTDGIMFQTFGTLQASVNPGNNNNYQFVDVDRSTNVVYYRVKAINAIEQMHNSSVVKLDAVSAKQSITISPNPVANHMLNIGFTNGKIGEYQVSLYTSNGALLQKQIVTVSEKIATQHIKLNSTIPPGKYLVGIQKEKEKQQIITIILN
jgi:hypothetical protein